MLKIVKKIIISSFLIYGYDVLIQPVGLIIPINFLTLTAVSFFGIPAMLSLIFILIFVY